MPRAGRGGLAHGGAARRCAVEWDADETIRKEDNRPFCSPGYRKQLSWTSLRKHEQRKHYIKRWGDKMSDWPAVDPQMITGLSARRRPLFVPGCGPMWTARVMSGFWTRQGWFTWFLVVWVLPKGMKNDFSWSYLAWRGFAKANKRRYSSQQLQKKALVPQINL